MSVLVCTVHCAHIRLRTCTRSAQSGSSIAIHFLLIEHTRKHTHSTYNLKKKRKNRKWEKLLFDAQWNFQTTNVLFRILYNCLNSTPQVQHCDTVYRKRYTISGRDWQWNWDLYSYQDRWLFGFYCTQSEWYFQMSRMTIDGA